MCQDIAAGQTFGTGRVLFDRCREFGALIIYTGQDRRGQEIEISLVDVDQALDGPRTPAEVRQWQVRDGVFFSAVYPDLRTGTYQIWWDRSTPAGRVTVRGGSVAEFCWPTRPGG